MYIVGVVVLIKIGAIILYTAPAKLAILREARGECIKEIALSLSKSSYTLLKKNLSTCAR